MSGDLEDMRAYARGYQDGQRSKDADHAAVELRLSRLTFDGNHHENLSKIAYAIYPCATGWTCESSKGLRDRLIDLLGGVHEHHCDSGRGCACGNRDSGDSGEHSEAMTYDVLGNERSKAVCRLRGISVDALRKKYDYVYVCTEFIWSIARAIGLRHGSTYEEIIKRLIYLIGGDQPKLSDLYGMWRDEQDSQESPNLANSGVDDGGKVTITDEFREAIETATKTYEGSWYEMNDADHTICHITEGELIGIADRMERRFAKAFISRGTKLGCYKLRINQLEAERDDLLELLKDAATEYMQSQNSWSYGAVVSETITLEHENAELRAKLEEADAAIANWRKRERSFEESERERDQLRRSLRQISEQAGVPHDRDLSEYGDGQITNAVIGQLGDTNQYVKSLEWVRDKRLPRIVAERDELKAKLDAIREALDGDH